MSVLRLLHFSVALSTAFLHIDATLAFVQPSAFQSATESFQMTRLPVDRFTPLLRKTLANRQNTTRNNGLVWLAGQTRHFMAKAVGFRLPRSRHCPCLFAAAYLVGMGLHYSELTTWMVVVSLSTNQREANIRQLYPERIN